MALWKLDGQEDVLCRNRCFASLTKKVFYLMRRFEDFRKIVFNENTVYVKHTVTSTLLFLESDLQLSYYLRGGRLHV